MSETGPVNIPSAAIIREQIGKTDAEIKQDLTIIREWLKKQPHLPQTPSDHLLESMLIKNAFSLEKLKKKLDMYYSVRTLFPQYFEDRAPSLPNIQRVIKVYNACPLPVLTPDYSRILLVSFASIDRGGFDIDDSIKYLFSVCDWRMNFDRWVNDYVILDAKNISMEHVRICTPSIIRNIVLIVEKGYSDIFKGIHIVNCSQITTIIINLFKSFMKKKIADRVHVHEDTNSLAKCFPEDCLPLEYGGNLGSSENLFRTWNNYLVTKEKWIVEMGNMKTNEELRMEKTFNSELFGLNGSFKRLEID